MNMIFENYVDFSKFKLQKSSALPGGGARRMTESALCIARDRAEEPHNSPKELLGYWEGGVRGPEAI